MAKVWRTILMTAAVAFAAGALGVFIGVALFAEGGDPRHASLDDVVHQELDLSEAQKSRIETMEARFGARKTSIEFEMRAATRAISVVVSEDNSFTPAVERAVGRFHTAMGELQRETLLHVFEMRAVLTPDQQRRFDKIVSSVLLDAAEEPRPK